ncbi:Exonuclease RNase T/DNA polymerase III [Penicillium sp. IBT 18751x]|nr:Exonuclease RNase T/DNA polymerase III [Penicillium sp. IBT 18751x]
MASNSYPETETWACPKCPKKGFKSQGAVSAHFMAKGHDLHCTICNRGFQTARGFIRHHKQHLNSDRSSFSPTRASVTTAASLPRKPRTTEDSLQVSDSKHETASHSILRRPATKRHQAPQHERDEVLKRSATKPQVEDLPKQNLKSRQNSSKSPASKNELFLHSLPERPAMDQGRQDMVQIIDQAVQKRSNPLPRASSPMILGFSGLAIRFPPLGSVAVVQGSCTDLSQAQSIHRHVMLQVQEQDVLFQELSTRCHSDEVLITEGYRLGTFSMPKKMAEQKPHLKNTTRKNVKTGPSPAPVIPSISFVPTPQHLPHRSQKKRRAVVLDCEMVQVEGNYRELAYLTAVDFLTGEILIDNYVQPTKRVRGWNTRYSGISCAEMNRARAEGRALNGWQHARQVLWEYVDADTVLIGHALQNDLKVLGFYHSKIVDSQILTSEAVSNLLPFNMALTRRWGLKTLVKELLEDDIQVGKKGHSALEDTLATRDLVIWCLRNQELLEVWAKKNRDEEVRKILAARKKAEENRKKRLEKEKQMEEQAERILQAIYY